MRQTRSNYILYNKRTGQYEVARVTLLHIAATEPIFDLKYENQIYSTYIDTPEGLWSNTL